MESLLNQSYSTFSVYGKSPEEHEDTVAVFASVLKPYTTDEITHAFKVHMHDGRQMPCPNDIVSIIKNSRPMSDYQPPKGREHFPTDEEIKAVEKLVSDHIEAVRPKEYRKNKLDYSHFESMPEEEQRALKERLRKVDKHYSIPQYSDFKQVGDCI